MRRNLDRYISEEKTKTVVLTLTNKCNLNCVYCYESNKSSATMSIELAKNIIAKEMNADNDFDMICIDFFGGEPFLEFDKMVEIHNYLKNNTWEKKWFCFATTNGTLVHGDVQEWLLNNCDTMEALLSLDGTPEMHNSNRSNSYDMIDIDFFKKTCPFVKMTISDITLPCLAEGIIFLHERGLHVSANLGYGVDWSNSQKLDVFSEQLHILIDYYLENPEEYPSTILDLGIEIINPLNTNLAIKYCGVGTQMTAYDVEGLDYPCHAFAPLSLGEEKAKEARNIILEKYIKFSVLNQKCQDCPVLNICPTCYGINFGSTGNIYNKDDNHCKMMKIQFLANAYFKYKQYEKGLLNITKEEEYRLLNNIKIVQTLSI